MKASLDFILTKSLFVKNRKGDDIRKFYNFEKIIGKGAFGICYKAKMIEPPYKQRVVKLLLKKKMKSPSVFVNEINLLKNMDHPSIIKVYEIFQDDKSVSIVMDYCQGGELFQRLDQVGAMNQSQARYVFKQMIGIIKYLHQNKICHRDLKPQNFLMLKRDSFDIMLIDFGVSFQWKKNMAQDLLNSDTSMAAGTSYYVSPEIVKIIPDLKKNIQTISPSYSEKCDIWSLGVLLYILVAACPPFDGETDDQIFSQIIKGSYSLQIPQIKNISDNLKDLIRKILVPQNKRLSILEIQNHEWMKESQNPQGVYQSGAEKKKSLKFSEIYTSSLQATTLKKIASSLLSSQLSAKQTLKYAKIFQQIDKDSNGELTLTQINRYFKKSGQKFNLSDLLETLQKIDTDKNGKISYNEFLSCCLESSILYKEEYLHYVFNQLDKNKNGKISADEFRQILEGRNTQVIKKEQIDALIKEWDKNGDGQIDFKELLDSIKGNRV